MADRVNRRTFLRWVAGSAAAVVAGRWVRPAGAAETGERPNVLLAMTDDQGWGDVGYNGHATLKTPALDEMARSGLRFQRFYSGAPVQPDARQLPDGAAPVSLRRLLRQQRPHEEAGGHARGGPEDPRLCDGALRQVASGHADEEGDRVEPWRAARRGALQPAVAQRIRRVLLHRGADALDCQAIRV